jgi:acyl-coenzyme A synthetase/AMP-(fatty) acid ligase
VLGERCKVIDENDNPVEPGSGVPGMVAIGPPNPVGYYKDQEKTFNAVMKEILLSITRAGADIILTYHAKEYARLARG